MEPTAARRLCGQCGGLAGVAGVLLASRLNAATPDAGIGYELDAIAAAVLGGCSLRGGEGSILGGIIGTALILVLRNVVTLVTNHSNIEFAIIGAVILAGVITDELVKRYAIRRRAARELAQ